VGDDVSGNVPVATREPERRAHADDLRASPRLAAQWVGLLLAPATFFAHLQGAYVLVPRACRYDASVWLHVVGVASVLLAAAGTLVAWRVWEDAGRHETTETGGPLPRARFLGVVGFVMSAMFVLLLLAQWVAGFVISPCQ
jgi:hypothetical protein